MDMSEKTEPIEQRRGIDRGRAWVVLIVSYAGMAIHTMLLYMNGVVYIALLRGFDESVTKTSLVPTLISSFTCFGSPVVSVIINNYSCRIALVIGGIFMTAGLALSAFVTNVNLAILTLGVLYGIGHACTINGCICAIGMNFDKYRNLFLTMCYIISGVGIFIATPLGLLVLDKLGLSSFFLVLAGISAHVCLIGVVIQPSIIEKEIKSKRTALKPNSNNGWRNCRGGFTLLARKDFLCFLCTNIAWGFIFGTCVTHVPNYVTTYGGTDQEIERVMIAFSIGNIAGRIAGFLVTNCINANSLYFYTANLCVSAILSMTFPLYTKFQFGVYILVIQAGICTGIPTSMMTQLPARFVGICELSDANGLSYFFLGLGFGTGPFITGFLYDVTRSYEYCFVFSGCIMLLGAIFAYVSLRLEGRRQQDSETDITFEVNGETKDMLNVSLDNT